jgi:hypothetical protein
MHTKVATPCYTLIAKPHFLPWGDFKGHLQKVTFVAIPEPTALGQVTRRWWTANAGTLAKDFSSLVPSSEAIAILEDLRRGHTVTFPGRFPITRMYKLGLIEMESDIKAFFKTSE